MVGNGLPLPLWTPFLMVAPVRLYLKRLNGREREGHQLFHSSYIYIVISINIIDTEPQDIDGKKPSNLFRIYKSISDQFK